jgi:hypothetical protein
MRIQIAAVGVAGMLALGLVQVPAASASTHPPRVGETVLKNGTWHKYEAKYWNLPGRIALLEPSNRELKGVVWDSATRLGGLANGIELSAIHSGGGAAVAIQVGRPRNGHFTRMTVINDTPGSTPQKFWWPAVVKRSTRRVWQQSNAG